MSRNTAGRQWLVAVGLVLTTGAMTVLVGPVASAGNGVDVLPPTQPQDVHVTDVTDSSVSLAWDPSDDPDWDFTIDPNGPFIGYRVYEDGRELGFSLDETFTVTGLDHVSTHEFTVEAYDRQDNRSPHSSPLTVTTLEDVTPPFGPGHFRVFAREPQELTLAWSRRAGAVEHVVTDGMDTQVIPVGTSNADFATPTPGTYTYTIRARDAAGNESAPATVTVDVEHEPPTAPGNLRRATGTVNRPGVVEWNASTDNSSEPLHYDVWLDDTFRLTLLGAVTDTRVDVQHLIGTLEGFPFDVDVPNGSFDLTVTATDASGNVSARSNAIPIVIP